MEFPGLGRNCGVGNCNRLDFLPMKCDACGGVYCKDHFTYNDHQCREAYRKDNQVPVCPLCNKPIPVGPGQTPDGRVGQHIDSDCQSNPAKEHRGKVSPHETQHKANSPPFVSLSLQIFKNTCSMAKCKKKEMVPFTCASCRLNFCLTHRLEADHQCRGFQNSGKSVSNSAAAALQREQKTTPVPRRPPSRPNAPPTSQFQGGMSEDEAMTMALRLSAAEAQGSARTITDSERQQQEIEDRMLAEALAASEQEGRTQRQQQQRAVRTNDGCALS